jgi:PAS domain S-box-containing protein
MRVLYVEDNALDAELICHELSEKGADFDVDLVQSLAEATARLDRDASNYDLVLSDLGLPDGDGLALLAHIRQLNLPLAVVITTGAGDEQTAVAALRAGADDYVVKGSEDMARLPAVLKGALQRFRAEHARRARVIHVLYAEDNETDADLVRHYIARHAPHIRLDVVDTPRQMYRLLSKPAKSPYDLLLLDYRLPGTNALEILRELSHVRSLDIPVVLITGQGDEEIAQQAMRLGAEDYVVKRGDYAQRLPFVLENAFHRTQLLREQAALRESEERYRNIVELAPDGILTMNLLGMVTSCNSAFLKLTGFSREEIVGRHFTKLPTLHMEDIPGYTEIFARIVQGTFGGPLEFEWHHKNQTKRWGEARISLVRKGTGLASIQAIVADTTEHKRTERLLEALNRAGLAMQRALTPDEIFAAVAQEFAALDIFCVAFMADENQDTLVPRYLKYLPGAVEAIEKLLRVDATQFQMSVDAVDVFRRGIRHRESTFVKDAEGVARALLPSPLKRFAGQIVRILRVPKFIIAPLVVEDKAIGLLSVQSADLTPEDVPTITAFAHQMAAAWHRAQLYEQAQIEIAERKRVAEALQESEERFRNVFENAPLGIYRTTPDGRVLMANPALVRMLGYDSFEDLAQLDMERRSSPDYDRAEFMRRLASEEQIIGMEAVWAQKDGTPLFIRQNAQAVRDADGAIAYYEGTVENITERRRAEQLLQALNQAALAMGDALTPEEIFAAVAGELEKLGFLCMILPTDESQDKVYTRYLRFKGKGLELAEKLVGLNHETFSFPIGDVEPYKRVIAEKETVLVDDTEAAMRRALPGPAKMFARQIAAMVGYERSIVAPLIVEGRVIGALSVGSSDLTREDMQAITAFAHQVSAAWRRAQLYEQAQLEIAERVRAEEALRASEERFRTLVQNSSDIIAILEADGTVRYTSPSLERVLGYPADYYLTNSNPFRLLHPEDIASTKEKFRAAISQPGVPIFHEFRIRHADGSWVSLETFTSNLLHVPSVGGLVVNARDVTERRRLEAQFRQAQKMEAVGRLAGGIAHDFNNLLTAMQGYTSLLLADLGSDLPLDESWRQRTHADLTEIKLAADRAAALTHQLLAFSRRQVLRPQLLDLNGLVQGMGNMLRRLIGEDIELNPVLAPSLGSVMADPGQIEQVIMNLVVNARDAMPQGGRLTIETSNAELDEAYARGHPGSQPGMYVMLALSDTGTGMDEETRSHLFEPFFTTKEKGKGTGLGLATVYGIVKQSGGHIWPQSEPGQGTTFHIYLPRVEQEGHIVEPVPEPNVLSPGTETVLLVEDEEIVRELARRILERQGYTVLIAGHPEAALRISESHTGDIDLLVTDVVMPGMSGRDLADRLLLSRPKTKVLYVSGYTDDAIVQHGVLDPTVDLVQKPFKPNELAQRVRKVLDGK